MKTVMLTLLVFVIGCGASPAPTKSADPAKQFDASSCSTKKKCASFERQLFKACDGGDGASCLLHGVLHNRKVFPYPSERKAMTSFRKGCDLGEQDSCQQLAVSLVTPGRYQDATTGVQLFEENCKKGNANACADIGDRYFKARDVKLDTKRGLQFMRQGCEMKSGYACAMYGRNLMTIAETKAEKTDAIHRLLEGCELKSARACAWSAEFGKTTGLVLSPKQIKTNEELALSTFVEECQKRRVGRSCGMAATMVEAGTGAKPNQTRSKELWRLGCFYDARVCEWRGPESAYAISEFDWSRCKGTSGNGTTAVKCDDTVLLKGRVLSMPFLTTIDEDIEALAKGMIGESAKKVSSHVVSDLSLQLPYKATLNEYAYKKGPVQTLIVGYSESRTSSVFVICVDVNQRSAKRCKSLVSTLVIDGFPTESIVEHIDFSWSTAVEIGEGCESIVHARRTTGTSVEIFG